MNCFIVVKLFIFVCAFTESSLISASLLPAMILPVKEFPVRTEHGHELDSERSILYRSGTTGGEYYELTNSNVFDIPEDILGQSMHIGSPGQGFHYSEPGIQASSDDDLVIVPSPYYEDRNEELDNRLEEDGEEESKNDYDEYHDTDNDDTNFNGNMKYRSENEDRRVKAESSTNNGYFQHIINNDAHLLENMNPKKVQDKQMEPLFLTPFAYANNYMQGRALAAVKPFVGDVRSYSGYLTVDQRFHSNLFFWFFPCERHDSEKRPVLLWLQGGPGATSLFGLFYENGPYKFVNGKIHRNEDTWTKQYNVIYIDNPVGTGFSFTSPEGYARNQTIIGKHLYEALKQFFHLFPELRNNDFYITGESYAGKYVPSAAYEIHRRNLLSHFKINLKGLFIGNGAVDPISMLEYNQYLYHIGLLDERQRDSFAKEEDKIKLYIRTRQWRRAANTFENLFFSSRANKTEGPNFVRITGFHQHYNLNGLDYNTRDFDVFVKDVSVRERLHVGYLKFNDGRTVADALLPDIMKSVIDKVNILVENYRVVLYYGQLDIICPYRVSEAFFHNIQFRRAYEYHKAERQIWTYERQDDEDNVVGYIKEAHNLVEVLIRNAGHMVPRDQPRFMMDLLRKYIGS